VRRRLIVQLDVRRLCEHLSRVDLRPWTVEQVLHWLRDAGFTPFGDRWLVDEADLGQVEPSEVISVEDEPIQ
jgi:hypothetical protein